MDSGNEGMVFMALIGEEEASIDDKGRVAISKKQRDRLGHDFVMTISEYGCVAAYPEVAWKAKLREINEVPSSDPFRVEYSMLFLGPAEDKLNCDKQGRVVVPRGLRESAGLKDRVVVVGVGDRYLIWNKDEYEKYKRDRAGYNREHREMVLSTYNSMRRQG